MDIVSALEETGKAKWHRWFDEEYVKKDGTTFIFINYEGKESPYNFDSLLSNDWQPYHEEKEIRPEKMGELWEETDGVGRFYHTDFRGTLGGSGKNSFRLEMIGDFTIEINGVVHGKNGWTRLYPPVRDENIERVEIEGVTFDTFNKVTVPYMEGANMPFDEFLHEPSMKMILEWNKDDGKN